MKATITTFFIILIVGSCKPETKQITFEDYLETSPPMKIPDSLTPLLYARGAVDFYKPYKRYKTVWSSEPLAKHLYDNGNVLVVDLDTGYVVSPVFILFDKDGNKLDSLYVESISIEKDIYQRNTSYIYEDRIKVISTVERLNLVPDDKGDSVKIKNVILDSLTYTITDSGFVLKN